MAILKSDQDIEFERQWSERELERLHRDWSRVVNEMAGLCAEMEDKATILGSHALSKRYWASSIDTIRSIGSAAEKEIERRIEQLWSE